MGALLQMSFELTDSSGFHPCRCGAVGKTGTLSAVAARAAVGKHGVGLSTVPRRGRDFFLAS